jgi:hypothetical protein
MSLGHELLVISLALGKAVTEKPWQLSALASSDPKTHVLASLSFPAPLSVDVLGPLLVSF